MSEKLERREVREALPRKRRAASGAAPGASAQAPEPGLC
jgi:hypothetical protein